MTNWYVSRDRLRDACGLAASATADNDQLDMTLETVSRLIDEWTGYHYYAQTETRYLTAVETARLCLDRPLLSIATLRTDNNGDASYETTWATTQFDLAPYNATGESPPQPFWSLERRASATTSFPAKIRRGVELAGQWGYFGGRDVSTANLATDINATTPTIQLNGATSILAGQTIRLGTEDMFVLASPTTASSTHSSQLTVQRAVNGTTGSTHSSATGVEVYRYPIVERAALYQAQQDFRRGLADPFAGGGGFGPAGGGAMTPEADLHPAVRRMLRGFRAYVVG